MRAITHQVTGVGLTAVGAAAADAPGITPAVLLGAAWVGSFAARRRPRGASMYRRTLLERRTPLLWLLGALLRLPVRLFTLLSHRGFTHSLAACALAAALAGVLARIGNPGLGPAAAGGLGISNGAHIIADAYRPSGVALLAPFSRRRCWFLPPPARIRTGSAREYGLPRRPARDHRTASSGR